MVETDGPDMLSEEVWIGRSTSDLVTINPSSSFSLCIVVRVVVKLAGKRAGLFRTIKIHLSAQNYSLTEEQRNCGVHG